jgi:MFS family permease
MSTETFETDVPARLDRLPFSRFHWLVVTALGVTWILDGLEVTLVGSLSPAIASREALDLTSRQVGLAGSAYILGAVLGALAFGRLTDRFGRRKLFTLTVGLYMAATIATAFSWDFWSFLLFRFLTGAGIGGEYGAVNSAIQELIPARRRGYTDLAINGSFWLGAAIGALGSILVLDPALVPQQWGWRIAFVIGGLLAAVVIWIRRYIPESPRWLMTHGRPEEAEAIVREIEARVVARHGPLSDVQDCPRLRLARRERTRWAEIGVTLLRRYPRRTALGLILMATQAFCYNAIFFTYALVLTRFYGVPAASIGWFMLPFALGQFPGPAVSGPAVRLARPQGDDRRHLRDRGRSAVPDRVDVRAGRSFRGQPDGGLDGDLLLRLGRGERGLSDGGRAVPAGDAGGVHLPILRLRHGAGRGRGARRLRRADRHRRARPDPAWLSAGRRTDAVRGGGGARAGRARGADALGGRLPAVVVDGGRSGPVRRVSRCGEAGRGGARP